MISQECGELLDPPATAPGWNDESRKKMNYLNIGDEIEVCGQRFILMSVTVERDKPSRVQFKQPIELLEENKRD